MSKWNNGFRYQVASCWLFILSYTAMHGSMNIKFINAKQNTVGAPDDERRTARGMLSF